MGVGASQSKEAPVPQEGRNKEKQIPIKGWNRLVVAMNERMCIQFDDEGQAELWKTDRDETAQLFKLDFTHGLYSLQNKETDLYINRPNSNYNTYIDQNVTKCFWRIVPAKAEDFYMIQCNDTEFVIGVENASSKNGAKLWLVKMNNTPAQLFKFKEADDDDF